MVAKGDTDWLDDGKGRISIIFSLIADFYGKTEAEVVEALRREVAAQAEVKTITGEEPK